MRLPICVNPAMMGVDISCPRFFEALIYIIRGVFQEGAFFYSIYFS